MGSVSIGFAKQGSVKEHIKRVRKLQRDACLDRLQVCCERYADLVMRDHIVSYVPRRSTPVIGVLEIAW